MINIRGGIMKKLKIDYRSGAVSLFVVIFAAILLTGVTVGFTILMLSDQNRSSDNDLSQSAKDSAEAGVEDAKRVLAQLTDCQSKGLLGSTDSEEARKCRDIQDAVNSRSCDTVSRALGVSGEKERKVAQAEGDEKLDQAYTCVTINPDTDAFVGKTNDESDMRVIPLNGTDSFDTVEVSWLERKDVPSKVNFTPPAGSQPSNPDDRAAYIALPKKADWGNRGSVIRVGAVPYNSNGVDIRDMDERSRTAFLYAGNRSTPKNKIRLDDRSIDAHTPIYQNEEPRDAAGSFNVATPVKCEGVSAENSLKDPLVEQGYLCKTSVKVKDINSPDQVYFTLASLYRATSFKLTLKDEANPAKKIRFKGVQPEIDSTGRANNVFRRIVSRVEAVGGESAPFPRAALGSSGSLCKSYIVTDESGDYQEDSASRQGNSGCYNLSTGNAF